jgi:hypothetical protein
MLTDAERRHHEKRLRDWGRGPRNARRCDLIDRDLGPGPGLTDAERAELAEIEAEADAIEAPLWQDQIDYLDEQMARQGLKWNEDRTQLVRIATGEGLGEATDAGP